MRRVSRPRAAAQVLGAILCLTGTVHFLRPGLFEGLIPGWLGSPTAWVYLSGMAEVACGLGLLVTRTRAWAGWASAALFVGVFPGNIQMAIDAVQDGSTTAVVIALVRLPLQVPLILWAVYVARSARARELSDQLAR